MYSWVYTTPTVVMNTAFSMKIFKKKTICQAAPDPLSSMTLSKHYQCYTKCMVLHAPGAVRLLPPISSLLTLSRKDLLCNFWANGTLFLTILSGTFINDEIGCCTGGLPQAILWRSWLLPTCSIVEFWTVANNSEKNLLESWILCIT